MPPVFRLELKQINGHHSSEEKVEAGEDLDDRDPETATVITRSLVYQTW